MAVNRWVKYGVSGALGLGVLAGAATMAASAMELRTDDGTVLDGGGVDANTLTPKVHVTATPGPHSSTPATSPTPSVASAATAPTPPAPPVQVEQPSPIYVDSPVSVVSAASTE